MIARSAQWFNYLVRMVTVVVLVAAVGGDFGGAFGCIWSSCCCPAAALHAVAAVTTACAIAEITGTCNSLPSAASNPRRTGLLISASRHFCNLMQSEAINASAFSRNPT